MLINLGFADYDSLIRAYAQDQALSFLRVSALVFIAYDVLITIEEEVELIWKARWSIPKLLYLFARYYGLVYLTLSAVKEWKCLPINDDLLDYLRWSIIAPFIFTMITDAILFLRVRALYQSGPFNILVIITFLVVADAVVTFYATIEFLSYAENWEALPEFPGQQKQMIMWFDLLLIPNLVVSSIFLFMTMWKLWDTSRTLYGSRWRLSQFFKTAYLPSAFFKAFVRDGTVFFVIIAAVDLLAILSPLFLEGSSFQLNILPWVVAIYTYSGTHLILNLRSAVRESSPTALRDGSGGGGGGGDIRLVSISTPGRRVTKEVSWRDTISASYPVLD